MRFFRRSLVALGVAALLPTVVFAAVSVFYLLRLERERVTNDTVEQSRVVMTLVDTQLQRHIAALDVLSSSIYFETQNWGEFYWRVQRLLGANPLWESIVLIDAQRREEIFDLRRPLGARMPVAGVHERDLQRVITAGTQLVGSIESHEHPVVWLYVPVRDESQGKVTHVIAASVKPRIFQDVLVAYAAPGTTAGIVDANGNFVARTVDYSERVGTPATQYVLDAIRAGRGGVYSGTTYEGLKNYTAYHTSASGWSTHLAVASASIDTPTRLSFVAAGIAALGGLVLGGFLIVLVLRDITERRRAEEMLRQSQKMEAIGQLTGGIAHDFNNLLTAVIGNLDMIRNRVQGERLQRMAENALEAARKGAKLASQLLAFSRSQRMDVGPVDLQQLLNGMSGLLSQSVGPSVHVDVQIDEDARYAISDSNQLELAILNLAVNARDAMPEGGSLTVQARPVRDAERGLPHVELAVADTGSGMTEEVRARAIEPFYTTKPTGQGTGLGLSQVYAVVRESGGTLAIDSEPGSGTTVRMILPAGAPTVVRTDTISQPTTTPSGVRAEEKSRVLVVDDDKLVRRFISDSLRSLQYHVTEAENGTVALAAMERERFDLLLVDFAMPGMNGAEVARTARERQPEIKVLMVSGYADSAAVESAPGSARLLRKPFDLTELGAAVAETLGV
jgi:signal transduction histidine kinase/CheY-like chemotaxis protein